MLRTILTYAALIMQKLASVAEPLRRLSGKAWVVTVAPFGLTMLYLLSVGPEVQRHTLPLLVSDVPRIYDAVYPDELARFPTLQTWLLGAIQPDNIGLAVIVTLVAFSYRTVSGLLVGAAVSCFLAQTLRDVFVIAAHPEANMSLAANLVGNALGSIAVALVAYGTLALMRFARQSHAPAALASSIIAASLVGAAISASVHFGLRILYRPLPVEVQAVGNAPLEGSYVPTDEDERADDATFSLVHRGSTIAAVESLSVRKAGSVAWQRRSAAPVYDLEVRLLEGCPLAERAIGVTGPVMLSRKGVSAIKLPAGSDNISISSPAPMTVDHVVSEGGYYWIKLGKKPGARDVTQFVRERDRFSIEASKQISIIAVYYLFQTTPKLHKFAEWKDLLSST